MKPSTRYIFVIDTEQYAGNFERALCAWCTGQVGECGVGKDIADKVPRDVSNRFDESLEHIPDEHGVARPCKLWETPGWSTNGWGKNFRGEGRYPAYLSVAIFFLHKPKRKLIDIIIKRSKMFNEAREKVYKGWNHEPITITGFRLLKETTSWEEVSLT
jgi:hypothetical protein